MGILYERAAVAFWQGIAEKVEGSGTAGEPGTPGSGWATPALVTTDLVPQVSDARPLDEQVRSIEEDRRSLQLVEEPHA
jgi:hypothetical protein